jgi:heme oxygenase (biliverdin-IX-beta and delta-forming)
MDDQITYADTTTLAEVLRAGTRMEHKAIELNPMMALLMDDSIQVGAYRTVLESHYGFYQPLEASFGLALDDPCMAPVAPLLEADLVDLGHTATSLGAIPRCKHLPSLHLPGALIGCQYVTAGSRLGGLLISRHIEAHLDSDGEPPLRYFGGGGDRIGREWRSFKKRLNDFGTHRPRSEWDNALSSARETFRFFDRWMKHFTALQGE